MNPLYILVSAAGHLARLYITWYFLISLACLQSCFHSYNSGSITRYLTGNSGYGTNMIEFIVTKFSKLTKHFIFELIESKIHLFAIVFVQDFQN